MPADDHLFNVPTGNLEADFSDLDDYDDWSGIVFEKIFWDDNKMIM